MVFLQECLEILSKAPEQRREEDRKKLEYFLKDKFAIIRNVSDHKAANKMASQCAKVLKVKTLEKGQFLMHQGDTSDDFLFLFQGKLDIYVKKDNKKIEKLLNQQKKLKENIEFYRKKIDEVKQELCDPKNIKASKQKYLKQEIEEYELKLKKIIEAESFTFTEKQNTLHQIVSVSTTNLQYKYFNGSVCLYDHVGQMCPFAHLGEIGLLTDADRSATLVASQSNLYLGVIEKSDFHIIFGNFLQNLNFPYSILKQLMPNTKKQKVVRLAYEFKPVQYRFNQVIFNEGDHPKQIFMIESGQVEIYKMVEDIEQSGKVEEEVQKESTTKEEIEKQIAENPNSNLIKTDANKKKKKMKKVVISLLGQGSFFGLEEILENKKTYKFSARTTTSSKINLLAKKKVLMLDLSEMTQILQNYGILQKQFREEQLKKIDEQKYAQKLQMKREEIQREQKAKCSKKQLDLLNKIKNSNTNGEDCIQKIISHENNTNFKDIMMENLSKQISEFDSPKKSPLKSPKKPNQEALNDSIQNTNRSQFDKLQDLKYKKRQSLQIQNQGNFITNTEKAKKTTAQQSLLNADHFATQLQHKQYIQQMLKQQQEQQQSRKSFSIQSKNENNNIKENSPDKNIGNSRLSIFRKSSIIEIDPKMLQSLGNIQENDDWLESSSNSDSSYDSDLQSPSRDQTHRKSQISVQNPTEKKFNPLKEIQKDFFDQIVDQYKEKHAYEEKLNRKSTIIDLETQIKSQETYSMMHPQMPTFEKLQTRFDTNNPQNHSKKEIISKLLYNKRTSINNNININNPEEHENEQNDEWKGIFKKLINNKKKLLKRYSTKPIPNLQHPNPLYNTQTKQMQQSYSQMQETPKIESQSTLLERKQSSIETSPIRISNKFMCYSPQLPKKKSIVLENNLIKRKVQYRKNQLNTESSAQQIQEDLPLIKLQNTCNINSNNDQTILNSLDQQHQSQIHQNNLSNQYYYNQMKSKKHSINQLHYGDNFHSEQQYQFHDISKISNSVESQHILSHLDNNTQYLQNQSEIHKQYDWYTQSSQQNIYEANVVPQTVEYKINKPKVTSLKQLSSLRQKRKVNTLSSAYLQSYSSHNEVLIEKTSPYKSVQQCKSVHDHPSSLQTSNNITNRKLIKPENDNKITPFSCSPCKNKRKSPPTDSFNNFEQNGIQNKQKNPFNNTFHSNGNYVKTQYQSFYNGQQKLQNSQSLGRQQNILAQTLSFSLYKSKTESQNEEQTSIFRQRKLSHQNNNNKNGNYQSMILKNMLAKKQIKEKNSVKQQEESHNDDILPDVQKQKNSKNSMIRVSPAKKIIGPKTKKLKNQQKISNKSKEIDQHKETQEQEEEVMSPQKKGIINIKKQRQIVKQDNKRKLKKKRQSQKEEQPQPQQSDQIQQTSHDMDEQNDIIHDYPSPTKEF